MANESGSSAADASLGEPDEVLYEADFILSQPEKSETLYLLQYPLRSSAVPVGSERVIEGVDVRARHGRVQMRLSVQPTIAQLGVKYGVSFDEDQPTKQIGPTQTLRSAPATTRPHANYAAARFVNGALVAAPLRSVSQMRPCFDYLDVADVEAARQRIKIEPKPETDDTPLQIAFPKRESEKAAERRRSSHAALVRREAEESWLPLEYKNKEDSEKAREALLGQLRITAAKVKVENAPVKQGADDDAGYLELYDAHTRRTAAQRRALKHGPVSEALLDLFQHARLVSFKNCLECTTAPDKQVLDALRNVAVCLRGNWVIKSAKTDTRDSNLIQKDDAARTLVLNLFRTSKVVTTGKAMKTARFLTEERVHAVLSEVSTRQKTGWVFKLPDDERFKTFCKDVVEKQESDWELRVGIANKLLEKGWKKKRNPR